MPNGYVRVDALGLGRFDTESDTAGRRQRVLALSEGGNEPSVTVNLAWCEVLAALRSESPHIPDAQAISKELASTFGAEVNFCRGDGRAIQNVYKINLRVAPRPPVHEP
jgi:hypothetical protein